MKEKAITIKQPYAHLICEGIKDIENRTWKTYYRGRVYIHSSGSQGRKFKIALTEDQMMAAFGSIASKAIDGYLSFGAIIGYVEIVDCVKNYPSIWSLPDHYHWVLRNPIIFDKPILNVKGNLSFWNCSEYLKLK